MWLCVKLSGSGSLSSLWMGQHKKTHHQMTSVNVRVISIKLVEMHLQAGHTVKYR